MRKFSCSSIKYFRKLRFVSTFSFSVFIKYFCSHCHGSLYKICCLQTEVTTVICGNKELKKLLDISGQLDTVKRVICMDDVIPSNASLIEGSSSWTITSFSDVERFGRENPVDADLPLPADIAVIMYTSGSTGMPKVSRIYFASRMHFLPFGL